ncbi:hypothetical protein I656_02315 [Geobacillus sp. WSUCF1]|nr:hypothetical protein I656_02315 [Geobacillus sp. WSUCF1]
MPPRRAEQGSERIKKRERRNRRKNLWGNVSLLRHWQQRVKRVAITHYGPFADFYT